MNYKIKFKNLILVLLVFNLSYCYSQDFIINSLKDELSFQTVKYKNNVDKPYFIQFSISDVKAYEIKCSFGSIINSDYNQFRVFTPELRIGDYKFDNTHKKELNSNEKNLMFLQTPQFLTIEDSLFQISKTIRSAVDEAYKNALDVYKDINKVYDDNTLINNRADFSIEKPNVSYDNPLPFNLNKKEWGNKLKEITDIFRKEEYIESAEAELKFTYVRKYVANTEGSEIVQNVQNAQINLNLLIRCTDNNIVPLIKSFCAFTPDSFPTIDDLKVQANELRILALKLKDAPYAEAYSGPCILSAGAAGVFFHEIFGHRVEGHRMNSKADAQTFKNKISDIILPDFLNILFDPTINVFNNVDLFGFYKYDDQAVSSQKVEVVKNGKLTNFLMCRTPTDSILNSNGHGRASIGMPAVSRQSNMFITSNQTFTETQQREQLIKICRKKKLEYGLYFKEVVGGFTNTSSTSPNVFNIIPTEVYKIYIDGRPDELVKGVALIGTPLTMFSEIAQLGNAPSVFNGYCIAESGEVPVSTISPSILVTKMETQKTFKNNIKNKQILRPDLIK